MKTQPQRKINRQTQDPGSGGALVPKQLAGIHYNQTQGVDKIKEAVLYYDQAYPRCATVGGSRGGGGCSEIPVKEWMFCCDGATR